MVRYPFFRSMFSFIAVYLSYYLLSAMNASLLTLSDFFRLDEVDDSEMGLFSPHFFWHNKLCLSEGNIKIKRFILFIYCTKVEWCLLKTTFLYINMFFFLLLCALSIDQNCIMEVMATITVIARVYSFINFLKDNMRIAFSSFLTSCS